MLKIVFKSLLGVLLLALISGCAVAPVAPEQIPENLKLRKDLTLPLAQAIGIYIPAHFAKRTEVFQGQIVQRGRFTHDGVDAVARAFFRTVEHRDRPSGAPIQLMLALTPDWSFEPGAGTLEMRYRLYDASGGLLLRGSKTERLVLGVSPDVFVKNLVIRVMQQVMVEVANAPKTHSARSTTTVAAFSKALLVDSSSPIRVATGFYVSKQGQVVTSSGFVEDCLRVDVGSGTAKRSARVTAQSHLLNLAVLSTAAPAPAALTFASGAPALGTATVAIHYVRDKDDKVNRGLSFGNVTSHDGVAGAFGVFQFAAANAPQTLGSAIVNPDGQVIGVFTGAYSYKFLHEQKQLQPNTYLALNGDLVAQFLTRSAVPFTRSAYLDKLPALDRASAGTVQVACYQ